MSELGFLNKRPCHVCGQRFPQWFEVRYSFGTAALDETHAFNFPVVVENFGSVIDKEAWQVVKMIGLQRGAVGITQEPNSQEAGSQNFAQDFGDFRWTLHSASSLVNP